MWPVGRGSGTIVKKSQFTNIHIIIYLHRKTNKNDHVRTFQGKLQSKTDECLSLVLGVRGDLRVCLPIRYFYARKYVCNVTVHCYNKPKIFFEITSIRPSATYALIY